MYSLFLFLFQQLNHGFLSSGVYFLLFVQISRGHATSILCRNNYKSHINVINIMHMINFNKVMPYLETETPYAFPSRNHPQEGEVDQFPFRHHCTRDKYESHSIHLMAILPLHCHQISLLCYMVLALDLFLASQGGKCLSSAVGVKSKVAIDLPSFALV